MSLENNEPKKDVQDQVKSFLSDLVGEAGDFLSEPASAAEPSAESWGQLISIALGIQYPGSNIARVGIFSPEKFLEIFAGMHATGYFENFSAIGMFQAGQQPQTNSELQAKMDQILKLNEDLEASSKKLRLHFKYVQKLVDEANIKNSHLQVENDVLRRENNRLRAAQDKEPAGETALDFLSNKRRVYFGLVLKKIRVIGGEGQ